MHCSRPHCWVQNSANAPSYPLKWNFSPHLARSIRNEIELLLLTGELRLEKPTVEQEVYWALHFFNETLFEAVPALHEKLDRALAQFYPGEPFEVPTFFQFGSWVGGDRDVLHAQKEKLLAQPKQLKLLGIICMVVGAIMTVTVVFAIAGIPSIIFGWWTWRFGQKNIAAIEAGFTRYAQSIAG